MWKRLIATALIAVLFALGAGADAQKEAAGARRALYVPRHASAKDLAAALEKHFKGAGPELAAHGASNALLLRGPAGVVDEALKVLASLDRVQRQIAVEVFVIEVPPNWGEPGKPEPAPKELDRKQFSGPLADVLAKVAELQQKDVLGRAKGIEVRAQENQLTKAKVGVTAPHVKAVLETVDAKGMRVVQRMLLYRDVGTTVEVTPALEAGNKVTLDVSLVDSRMHLLRNKAPLARDEKVMPIYETDFITAEVKGKVTLPSGHAVALEGVKTTAKFAQEQTLVIVTARVVEAAPDKEK